MTDVSIVILFSREAAMAERCLRAVAEAAEPDLDTEIVALLNVVPPATRAAVRDLAPDARVIESPVNTGTNAGWNLAFAAARGRRIALIHEDTEPEPGWLGELVRVSDANPRAAIVGSRILYPGGELWSPASAIWQDGYATLLNADLWPRGAAATEPECVDSVQSAALLVERDVWQAIGGFDERLFPAMASEHDLAIAAWLRGRTVMTAPASRVVHASGAMVREDRGARGSTRHQEFLWRRARGRLVDKWGDALARFGPLPPGKSALDVTPEDVERDLAAAAARAAEPPADLTPPGAAPSRFLTAPDGGMPTEVDDAMAARFDAAQWGVEREFADWLLGRLDDIEAAHEWMTGQRECGAGRARLDAG